MSNKLPMKEKEKGRTIRMAESLWDRLDALAAARGYTNTNEVAAKALTWFIEDQEDFLKGKEPRRRG